jgi:hypothetical protein
MRTVKLTIEVEVPDDAEWVTVDKYGLPESHMIEEPVENCKDDPAFWVSYKPYERELTIKNWRDLKINLNEYFEKKCERCGSPLDWLYNYNNPANGILQCANPECLTTKNSPSPSAASDDE